MHLQENVYLGIGTMYYRGMFIRLWGQCIAGRCLLGYGKNVLHLQENVYLGMGTMYFREMFIRVWGQCIALRCLLGYGDLIEQKW